MGPIRPWAGPAVGIPCLWLQHKQRRDVDKQDQPTAATSLQVASQARRTAGCFFAGVAALGAPPTGTCSDLMRVGEVDMCCLMLLVGRGEGGGRQSDAAARQQGARRKGACGLHGSTARRHRAPHAQGAPALRSSSSPPQPRQPANPVHTSSTRACESLGPHPRSGERCGRPPAAPPHPGQRGLRVGARVAPPRDAC